MSMSSKTILEADWAYAAPVKPNRRMRTKFIAMFAKNIPIVTQVGPHIKF